MNEMRVYLMVLLCWCVGVLVCWCVLVVVGCEIIRSERNGFTILMMRRS